MIDLQPGQGPRLVLQFSIREGGIHVRAVESPEGGVAARVDSALPPLDDVWQMARQPVFHDEAGQVLFASIFGRDLRDVYAVSRRIAAEANAILTLDLRFDRDTLPLARYPWELLHDGVRFVLATDAVNLVRSVRFAAPAESPHTADSGELLEVLLAEAMPHDYRGLVSEFDALQTTLDPALRAGRLDLAYLMPPTWDALMDWLLAGAPDVLHFAGYADLARLGLIFENPHGETDSVAARHLGDLLYSTRLRLAVLSATAPTKTAGESRLGAVAPALVAAGIPAVVAMQQSLPEAAASRFARGFYAALLAGRSIETAMQIGRRQLARSTFWHIPTLTVRGVSIPDSGDSLRDVWIDTAAPQIGPVHGPFRIGVWVREAGAPPDSDSVQRLTGCTLDAGTNEPVEQPDLITTVTGPIQPGHATLQISAPGCEVHEPNKPIMIWAHDSMPPVWIPITPRQPGTVKILIKLVQGRSVIAAVTHSIQVVKAPPHKPLARLHSWRLVPAAQEQSTESSDDSSATGEYASIQAEPKSPAQGDVIPMPPPTTPINRTPDTPASETSRITGMIRATREIEHEPDEDREREQDRRRGRESTGSLEAAQREPLDGVLDWLQAGEQPVRDKDDPMMRSDDFIQHEETFERFPVGDIIAPTVGHVFDADQDAAAHDAGDEPTLIVDMPHGDAADDLVDRITDDEWLEWLKDWRSEE